jgi:CRISPR/Cas system endoribonuclease Cas6 (RAMP superfamily)
VGGVGMIFLGDFLGQTMTKQDPDFLIGGVSAVIVSYSVWRYFNAYSRAEHAIAIYNSDHKSDELYRRGYSIGFGFNPRGFGFTLTF